MLAVGLGDDCLVICQLSKGTPRRAGSSASSSSFAESSVVKERSSMGATTWPAAKSRPERNLDWRPTPLMRLRPKDFCLSSSSARFDRLPPMLRNPWRTVTGIVDRMPGMKDRRTTSTSPPRSASSLSRLKFSTSGARAATARPHAPSRFVGGGDFPRLGADGALSI